MADEIVQRLGLDASQALSALRQLSQTFGQYAKNVQAAAKANTAFTTSGREFLTAIGADVRAIADAVKALGQLQKAQDAAAAAAQRAAEAEAAAARKRQSQARATGIQRGAGPALTAGLSGDALTKANAFVQKIAEIGAKAGLSAKQVLSIGNNLNKALVGPQRQIQQLITKLNELRNVPPPKPPAELGSSFLGAVVAANLLSNAISKLTNAFTKGIQEAIEYEIILARISTIAGPTGGSIEQLGAEVRRLSDEFGRPITDVALGQYELLSNQIGNAAQSTQVLTAALKLSNVTGATTAQSVNAISSVINSYNLSAAEAEEISGKLFRAVDLGRFTLDQVADSMGRVTVTASQLGVSIDEVLASLATLTITGVPADEAMTLLSNTMRGLLKPTDATKDAFRQLGVANAEAGIQAFGLLGFLEKLTEVGGDTASEITQMTENIRVARGVIGLTGDQADRAAESLRNIKEAGAEVLNQKNEIIIQTNAKQVQTEMNQVANLFIVDIGQNAVAGVNQLTQPIGGLSTAINGLIIAGAALAAGFAIVKVQTLLASGSLTALTGQLTLTSAGFLTATTQALSFAAAIAPIAIPIAALTAAILLMGNEAQREFTAMNSLVEQLNKTSAATAKAAAETARFRAEGEKLRFDKQASDLQKLIAELNKLNTTELESALRNNARIVNSFRDQISQRVQAYEQYVNKVRDAEKRAADIALESFNKISDLTQNVSNNRFERSLIGLSDQSKGIRQLERVNQLLDRAFDTESQGTEEARERAQKLREEAAAMADQVASSAATAKNRGLLAKAESAVDRALASSVESEKRRNNEAVAAAKVAREQLAAEQSRLSEIKSLEDQIRQIQDDALSVKSGKTQAERLKDLEKTLPLAQQIEKLLAGAGDKNLAKSLGLDSLLRDVRKPFLDQFGKEIKLEVAFDSARERLQKELSSEEFVAKVKLVAEPLSLATGLDINKLIEDGAGLGQAASAITERSKAVEAARNAATDLPNKMAAVEQSTNSLTGALGNLNTLLANRAQGINPDANVVIRAAQVLASSTTEISTMFGRIPPQLAANAELFATVQQSVAQATASLKQNAAADISPTINAIRKLADTEIGKGNTNAGTFLNQLADGLGELSTKTRDLQTAQNTIAFGEKIKAQMDAASQALGPVDKLIENLAKNQGALTTSSQAGATATAANVTQDGARATSAKQMAAGINEAAAAQERLNRANSGSTGGAATGKASGGTVYRASGGMVYLAGGGTASAATFKPRGTDTVPAMLSPGEFVVNARSTRKFYSQLVAMNAGRQPAYRAEGGPVTNVNVGDINVNSQGSNGQVLGRDIWRSIDRAARRGTITRLNRKTRTNR